MKQPSWILNSVCGFEVKISSEGSKVWTYVSSTHL